MCVEVSIAGSYPAVFVEGGGAWKVDVQIGFFVLSASHSLYSFGRIDTCGIHLSHY